MADKSELFAILGIFVYLSTLFISAYNHEIVHKLIFNLYGCKNATIRIGLLESYTTAKCNLTIEQYREMESLHIMNEIIAYNLFPWLAGLLGINLLGWYYVLAPNRRREESYDMKG